MKILVLPGIGDIHWCMLKMEAFLKAKDVDRAMIGIWTTDNRPRAIEYVKRIPFVSASWYAHHDSWRFGDAWKQLTKQPDFDIIECHEPAYDYIIGFNGSLESGKRIELIKPNLKVNWDYSIIETPKDTQQGNDFANQHGEYALIFHANHGHHKNWPFDLEHTIKCVKSFGLKPILTGAKWDETVQSDSCESITGKTDLGKLMAIIRRAKLFVGYAAGNGILATHFKVPTVLLWSSPYRIGFDTSWNNPDAPYLPCWYPEYLKSSIQGVLNGWPKR
jgi:ADP-heptose:LPS heptosyltransferase